MISIPITSQILFLQSIILSFIIFNDEKVVDECFLFKYKRPHNTSKVEPLNVVIFVFL